MLVCINFQMKQKQTYKQAKKKKPTVKGNLFCVTIQFLKSTFNKELKWNIFESFAFLC